LDLPILIGLGRKVQDSLELHPASQPRSDQGALIEAHRVGFTAFWWHNFGRRHHRPSRELPSFFFR